MLSLSSPAELLGSVSLALLLLRWDGTPPETSWTPDRRAAGAASQEADERSMPRANAGEICACLCERETSGEGPWVGMGSNYFL